MTTMRTLTTISAALLLLGSTALVACGGGPDKVDSPVDQQTSPTDPVADPKAPTDPATGGAGGGATEEPKTDGTDGEEKPGEPTEEGGAARE